MMSFFKHMAGLLSFVQTPRAQRRVVFYSEGPTYWVHLQGLVQALLASGEVPVCYVSSNPADPGLALQHANYKTFLIDQGWVRNWFFENLQADVLVMTMPDLDQYQVKRSKHPVHYVYVQHSLVSFHMVYRPGAFDAFDSVFCAGPHHLKEIDAITTHKNLPPKHVVAHGYERLDAIIHHHAQREPVVKGPDAPIHVLLAPSWGPHCILETVGAEVVAHLLENNFRVTVRPHPQTRKFAAQNIRQLEQAHGQNPLFSLETGVAGQETLHQSDLMICDWSGAALDYAFGLHKPVLFIDVPRKVNNPDYPALNLEPFEATIRPQIGRVLPVEHLQELADTVRSLLQSWQPETVAHLRHQHVFNVGQSSKAGAAAIQKLLQRLGPN